MNQSLVFKDVAFTPVARSGEPWLRLPQIGVAFGYAQPHKLQQIYSNHADEFTSLMTDVVELDTAGGRQPVRIFSLRGAHLLGMFARTERAKEFRRWVLNVLETYNKDTPVMAVLPAPSIDKDTELAIKQRARVLAESFYPLYCLQMRHAVKSGQIAPAHVASWLPNGNSSPAIGFPGEPNSRWTVCYDEKGIPQVRRMKIGQRLVDHEDYQALHDAITVFRGRCEPPFGKPIN